MGKETGLRSTTIYGGVSFHPQAASIRRGVEIVVACPGRLLDHISQNTISFPRWTCSYLTRPTICLTWASCLMFGRILRHVPNERQTLMFSATMPSDIRRLAHDVLRDPVTVQIGHSVPVGTVFHALYPVASHLKTPLLMDLLEDTDTEVGTDFCPHQAPRKARRRTTGKSRLQRYFVAGQPVTKSPSGRA